MLKTSPKPGLAAWILLLVFASVCCNAIQPMAARLLTRFPAAMQKTILAEIGNGELLDIHRSVEDGAVVFQIEMSRNGRTREFTVATNGELIDVQVFLDETPPRVQKAIVAAAGGGKVTDISKTLDAGKTVYDVELAKGGRTRNFTVSADGQLLDMEVFLDETPSAVKETITAQVGKGRLVNINRIIENGETVYEVEMTKAGGVRDFIVTDNGNLFGLKVSLKETPPAVQETVQTQIGKGRLLEIEKTTEDGALVYEIKMEKDGRSRNFTVNGDGGLLEMEVFLDETPAAVKQTVQSQMRDGQLADIYRTTEDGDTVYEAEITTNGKSRSLTVDSTGAILSEEESVALSDTPAEVQKTIQTLVGSGALAGITQTREEDGISYLVELNQTGKKQSVTLDANGKVLSLNKD